MLFRSTEKPLVIRCLADCRCAPDGRDCRRLRRKILSIPVENRGFRRGCREEKFRTGNIWENLGKNKRDSVHKFVVFCFQFRYSAFKTLGYLNNRKVAEAVSRSFRTP